MKTRGEREIPVEQILKMTKELSPDDLEIGEVDSIERTDLENWQDMVEMRDDYSPDDNLFTTSRKIHLGHSQNDK